MHHFQRFKKTTNEQTKKEVTSQNLTPTMPNYITTHNAEGKAIFSNAIPSEPHKIPLAPNSPSTLEIVYTSHVPKPDFTTETDLTQYTHDRIHSLPPGQICPPNGFGVNILTLGPGKTANHRTATLDVVYILEGVIELTLDSGEMRVVREGDTVVQRGTMHQWDNVTPGGGLARILGVAVTAKEPFLAGGREVGTEWLD